MLKNLFNNIYGLQKFFKHVIILSKRYFLIKPREAVEGYKLFIITSI